MISHELTPEAQLADAQRALSDVRESIERQQEGAARCRWAKKIVVLTVDRGWSMSMYYND